MLSDTVLKTSTYYPFCIDELASSKNTTRVDTAQIFTEKKKKNTLKKNLILLTLSHRNGEQKWFLSCSLKDLASVLEDKAEKLQRKT